MRPHEIAEYDRIIGMKAERLAEIAALQREFNRCGWCGEAPVSPNQAFCLTHAGKAPL